MADQINYPDVLGALTGGARANIGMVQAAVALRPRVVRAGRPFEVLLLLQSAADIPLDVAATLHLPEHDANRQPGKFVTKQMRVVVGMEPAEVGYVVLPATALPDTAISDGYKLAVEIEAKAAGKDKPERIRVAEGGGAFDPAFLSDRAGAEFEGLRSLAFSASKRLGRPILEAPLSVMPGRLGAIPDFHPGWVSLFKLLAYHDPRPMLHGYSSLLLVQILPKLKRLETFKPLLQATHTRFRAAGYELAETEASLIAKLLTLLLEYASPNDTGHGYVAAGAYAITPLLMNNPLALQEAPVLPQWLPALLQLVEREPRALAHPAQTVAQTLYDTLLADAAHYAFQLVERETGIDLGDAEEQSMYVDQLVAALNEEGTLDFGRVYLPLILGGILVNDQLPIAKDPPGELLKKLSLQLEARMASLNEADRPLLELVNGIISRTGQKYGFRTAL